MGEKKLWLWRFEPKTFHFSSCTRYHLTSHYTSNLDKIRFSFKFTLEAPLVWVYVTNQD